MRVLPLTLITYQEAGGEANVKVHSHYNNIISVTLNLALLCIIYIQWINEQINKEK